MEIYIGIPCYNVSGSVIGVLDRLVKYNHDIHIILVDDGSTDGLVETLNAVDRGRFLSFLLIHHDSNRGYGAAQRTIFDSFRRVAVNPYDKLILVHGDGQTDESEIGRFVQAFDAVKADAVLGSRMLLGIGEQWRNGRPAYKILFDYLIRFLLNSIFSLNYSTYASGYRAYNRSCLDKLDLSGTADHYVFDSEMLLILGKYNIRYVEIPVKVIQVPRRHETLSRWWTYGLNTLYLIRKYHGD